MSGDAAELIADFFEGGPGYLNLKQYWKKAQDSIQFPKKLAIAPSPKTRSNQPRHSATPAFGQRRAWVSQLADGEPERGAAVRGNPGQSGRLRIPPHAQVFPGQSHRLAFRQALPRILDWIR